MDNGIKKIKVMCYKCGHRFLTRSKLNLISCANCGGKIDKLSAEKHFRLKK